MVLLENEKQEDNIEETVSEGADNEEAVNEEASLEEDTKDLEEADEEGAETLAEDSVEKEKRGFFGKKKEKKDKKDEQIEELTDRLKRSMAEFENFRKRTGKEKEQMFETGAKSVIEKILPIVDNFERGLASATDEDKANPVVEGMEMVYKQLMTTLEEIGVKAIEAEGMEFDPNLHNAVMHEENEELGENIVSAELQKGYTYRDTVVRHSMVKVAN